MSCEDRDHIDCPGYYLIIYSITSGNGHKAGLFPFPQVI